MNDKKVVTTSSGGGLGFCSLLTIVFIVLKLCHVIEWSWFWVLSPLWISFSIGLIVFILVFIALLINDY